MLTTAPASLTDASVSLATPSVRLTTALASLTDASVSLATPSVRLTTALASLTDASVSPATPSVRLTTALASLTDASVSVTGAAAGLVRTRTGRPDLLVRATGRRKTEIDRLAIFFSVIVPPPELLLDEGTGWPSVVPGQVASSTARTREEEIGAIMSTSIVSAARTKTTKASLVQNLIVGANKHFPNASQSLTFGGATRTVTALTQLLQSYVDLRTAVIASQAATKTKIVAERAQTPSLLALIDEFVAFVKVTFGNQPDALADFGLAPPKARTPLTAEQKAVAAAKRAATRTARGTKGKVQKKGVKGAVNATLVVTPLAGPPPTAPVPAGGTTPHAS
jgi:hypothetical protein